MKNVEHENKLYTKAEAADLLSIGKEMLGRLIKSGLMGYIKLGNRVRIPGMEITKFLNEQTIRTINEKDELDASAFIEQSSTNVKTAIKPIDTTLFNQMLKESNYGQYI